MGTLAKNSGGGMKLAPILEVVMLAPLKFVQRNSCECVYVYIYMYVHIGLACVEAVEA